MDFALGALLGLAYIAAPGPINLETIRWGLAAGARAGLAVQVGAALGDAAYAVLVLVAAGILLVYHGIQMCLGVAGTALLLYLGGSALYEGWQARVAPHLGQECAICATPSDWRMLGLGATISLANPYAIAFWLAIDGSVLHQPHRNGVLFLGGFFLSVLLWAITLPLAVERGRALLRGRLLGWLSLGCGLGLLLFGLALGQALFTGQGV